MLFFHCHVCLLFCNFSSGTASIFLAELRTPCSWLLATGVCTLCQRRLPFPHAQCTVPSLRNNKSHTPVPLSGRGHASPDFEGRLCAHGTADSNTRAACAHAHALHSTPWHVGTARNPRHAPPTTLTH